ncbi:unnamed protein product [Linum trigynum]|uniref:Uncharacterized protein n=1 Tax=Linum trigynum TaxID=586398 RepID=A0AAV2GIM8_9ROSI
MQPSALLCSGSAVVAVPNSLFKPMEVVEIFLFLCLTLVLLRSTQAEQQRSDRSELLTHRCHLGPRHSSPGTIFLDGDDWSRRGTENRTRT